MDASLFTKMLSDKSVTDLKKLGYKYPQADMKEFVELLGTGFYKTIPLKDFNGVKLVYLESVTQVRLSAAKVLLTPQASTQLYGVKAMEEEIISTFTIEQIDTSRDSIRKILSGYAPSNESENRIYGMKKGLEFISDPANKISEETIYQLYELTIGAFLPEEDRLLPGNKYRHDSVYIVGDKVEHTGLPWQKLSDYMGNLVSFIDEETSMNDLLKAALIHFYIAYLHPWFDGNGRMARLMHLWYLVQQGYSSALFVPLSEYVEKSRKGYYDAYTLAEPECPDQRCAGCDALSCVFHRECVSQAWLSSACTQHHGHIQESSRAGRRDRKGAGPLALRPVRLRRRRILYQAVGKGFRQRRICNHSRLCPEVRKAGLVTVQQIWKPHQVPSAKIKDGESFRLETLPVVCRSLLPCITAVSL